MPKTLWPLFSYQEDSVHFPPELTDPALLAEVIHFIIQRFACSSLKRHSQHHLRLFLQQVSQGNSLLYFAFCSGGFFQAFSRPESERGDKHLISLFSHSKTGTLEKSKLQLEDCDGLPILAPPVREFKLAKIQVKLGWFLLN